MPIRAHQPEPALIAECAGKLALMVTPDTGGTFTGHIFICGGPRRNHRQVHALTVFLPQTITQGIHHQPLVMLGGFAQLQQQMMYRFAQQTVQLMQVPGAHGFQRRIRQPIARQRPLMPPAHVGLRPTGDQRRITIMHIQLAGRAQQSAGNIATAARQFQQRIATAPQQGQFHQ